jgi:arginine/serine-rich splicing factor 12
MPRTKRAGRKSKRRGRRGIIKLASGLGSRSVRDVGRGVGKVVGYVPVVGRPGRKAINVGSRMAGDAVTLVGNTTNRAAGILTTPFKRLFGMKKRTRKRTRKRMRRRRKKSRSRMRKRSRSRKRKSRSRMRKRSRSRKRKSRSRMRKRSRRRTRRRVKRRRKKSRSRRRK